MAIFLAGVAIVCAFLFPAILPAFLTNVMLNGLIIVVLLIGIVYTVRQVVMLDAEVVWLVNYRSSRGEPAGKEPQLLAPMATLLRARRANMSLSTVSMRSILDTIGSRLDESREITRYLISLLVFLGLLGTFWGLLGTIGGITGAINGLSVSSSDFAAMFEELKQGLSEPLSGMGTAFSSSLFGLAGSVILGFIDLQAGQAQNRFYNDLEEWLSSVTRLSSGSIVAEGEGGSAPAYLSALLEQTAEGIGELQRIMEQAEQNRTQVNSTLVQLSEKLATLTDHLRGERNAFREALAQARPNGGDDIAREHLASIDVQIGRLVKEAEASREQMSRDLRTEIKLLARTIGARLEERDAGE